MAGEPNELKRLIERTQMAHIYKPVLLQAVLRRGGSATKAEIAADILNRDVLQQEHYVRNVIDKMPGARLVRDGALVKVGDRYELAAEYANIKPSEMMELAAACERRIEDFTEKYGDKFKGRNDKTVPGSLRFEVLKRAGGRCELCGVSHEEAPLDVDHIVPRARGGSNDPANLQALCRTCNAQKGAGDDTDFRAVVASYDDRDADCIFCQKEHGDDELAFVVVDGFPVTEGHSLIIPRRHVTDFFDLRQAELNAVHRLLHRRRQELRNADPSISGFNVGVNCGVDAGQTIFHAHIHLIPRRTGDTPEPRGGVRGVIPGKGAY